MKKKNIYIPISIDIFALLLLYISTIYSSIERFLLKIKIFEIKIFNYLRYIDIELYMVMSAPLIIIAALIAWIKWISLADMSFFSKSFNFIIISLVHIVPSIIIIMILGAPARW